MLTAGAFLLAFVAGCLMALVRHPIWGLVTYVGLVFIHPPAQWWGKILPSLRWSLIAAAVTLIAVVLRRTDTRAWPISRFGIMTGLITFLVWLVIQLAWALNRPMHIELLVLMAKYTLLVVLIYKCIETVDHLRIFLWAHAAGCFYLGFIVFTQYIGGRFEGFEMPGLSESNAAALMITTGIITTFVLFLSGRFFEKSTAIGFMPFTLNALVATISRSGFVALFVAGSIFNLFTPKKHVAWVRISSIVGLALFIVLTNPVYWERIATILVAGEQVEGVNTGSNRLVLVRAQVEMSKAYPMGCGHRCTAVLSPSYLDDKYLTGPEDNRARSSHNTFMALLVEQGIPGAIFYILLLIWMVRTIIRLKSRMRKRSGLLALTYAATVAILGAITVGDVFVDYLKFEPRLWFIALLLVLTKLDMQESNAAAPELTDGSRPALARKRRGYNRVSSHRG